MYICVCHGISDRQLREELDRGVRGFEELRACTGVATCCGACESSARELCESWQSASQRSDSVPSPA